MNVGNVELEDVDAGRLLGVARIAVGAIMLVAPRFGARLWTGERDPSATTVLAARGMGGRDLALGIGLVSALEKGTPARGWLEAGVLADASDTFGALVSSGELPLLRRLATLTTAGAAVWLGLRLAASIDD
ncbi:MAG: hypothetical protein ACRDJJ_05435 [Actinomycetota bacterium]